MKALNMTVFNVSDVYFVNDIQQLIDQHTTLFFEEPGTFQKVSVKLSVREGAKPRFFKARSVQFALLDKVLEEIQRLEREGILEPVKCSD